MCRSPLTSFWKQRNNSLIIRAPCAKKKRSFKRGLRIALWMIFSRQRTCSMCFPQTFNSTAQNNVSCWVLLELFVQMWLSNNHFRYELYAVITHTGISLTAGHYKAYVQAPPEIKDLVPESWKDDEVKYLHSIPQNIIFNEGQTLQVKTLAFIVPVTQAHRHSYLCIPGGFFQHLHVNLMSLINFFSFLTIFPFIS